MTALASEDSEAYGYREADLPQALGPPAAQGRIRVSASDFRVDEELSFEPDGEGAHWMVRIEKRDATTDWIAGQLARQVGVRRSDVGHAGLKDRHAVTWQWFSVPVVAGTAEPDQWELDQGRVLSFQRHRRKLRTGALIGNRFSLMVRDVEGEAEELDRRLAQVASYGVPNYFGPQRFGREGDNVARLLRGRLPRRGPMRGILLSAGRSWLFNAILARRVRDRAWYRPLEGDLMMLAGSRSYFAADPADPALEDRCRRGDIHPSGALWGEGPSPAGGEVAALEDAVAAEWPAVVERLAAARMDHDRRSLRLPVGDLRWSHEADTLKLDFRLPAGAFATSVLRELLTLSDARGE